MVEIKIPHRIDICYSTKVFNSCMWVTKDFEGY